MTGTTKTTLSDEAYRDVVRQLTALDVSHLTEKKGRFTYLPWADAVDQLNRVSPEASLSVHDFPIPEYEHCKVPYLETKTGFFVKVTCTIFGHERSSWLPVLDNNNKVIAKPNAFDINRSIQRCLAKAIAMHGLGLYIFRGEDLPDAKDIEPEVPPAASNPAGKPKAPAKQSKPASKPAAKPDKPPAAEATGNDVDRPKTPEEEMADWVNQINSAQGYKAANAWIKGAIDNYDGVPDEIATAAQGAFLKGLSNAGSLDMLKGIWGDCAAVFGKNIPAELTKAKDEQKTALGGG